MRLYPPLIVGVALAVMLSESTGSFVPQTRQGWWPALLYLADVQAWLGTPTGLIGHAWSLAAEAQFYALWLLVLLLFAVGTHGASHPRSLAVLAAAALRANIVDLGMYVVVFPLVFVASAIMIARLSWGRGLLADTPVKRPTVWIGQRLLASISSTTPSPWRCGNCARASGDRRPRRNDRGCRALVAFHRASTSAPRPRSARQC